MWPARVESQSTAVFSPALFDFTGDIPHWGVLPSLTRRFGMIGMRLLSFQKRARLRAVLAISRGTVLRGRKSPWPLSLSR